MELKTLFIQDLKNEQRFQSAFRILSQRLSVGKNGRSYLSLELGDKTGQMDARVWDQAEVVNEQIAPGQIVLIKGQIQSYQGRLQIVVFKADRVDTEIIRMEDFIPPARVNVSECWSELNQLFESLANPHIKQLALNTLKDPELSELLKKSPAARSVHHNWPGGLLEHVLSICKTLNHMSAQYAFLNRDLLLFGGLFHDIGKIWELTSEDSITYTRKGRLLGHILMGCELIQEKAKEIPGFPEDILDLLKHMVLAHHGKLEYGSPKRPKFLEAMMVSYVDELDSQIMAVKSLMDSERASGASWTRYSEQFDRYFLLDDLFGKLE